MNASSRLRTGLFALLCFACPLILGLPLATLLRAEDTPAAEPAAETPPQNVPPQGFVALFNGQDLSGWKGLVGNPISRAAMSDAELAEAQAAADEQMREHWRVENGELIFDGQGESLCTLGDYADFEMYVDFKITPGGDSGIYLRGSPQVQIWDPASEGIGSGGLYNNQHHPDKPLVTADNPVGEWNTFYIRMWGDQVTVRLNGQLVVDNVPLENYWDRNQPIFPTGQIELQNHGSELRFRNIFIRELVLADEALRTEETLPHQASIETAEPRKLLVFVRATGFPHRSIPHGARAVQRMGQVTGAYEANITDDVTEFAPDKLAEYDAIVLSNTTGNWIYATAADAQRLSTDEKTYTPEEATELLKQSLLDFIENGGGLVGIHSATDANYEWPEFGHLIGGYFNGHPWHELVGLKIEHPDSELSEAFGKEPFEVVDEIYQFRDPYDRDNLMVLLSLDPERAATERGQGGAEGDYPVAWIREQGEGHVFYCSLGHREEIFWNPVLLKFYLDGIQYATGDLTAEYAPGFGQ